MPKAIKKKKKKKVIPFNPISTLPKGVSPRRGIAKSIALQKMEAAGYPQMEMDLTMDSSGNYISRPKASVSALLRGLTNDRTTRNYRTTRN